MHARDDDHVFADHAIEDSVRKPPNETPPSVSVSDGMCGGVHLDRAQRSPYRVEELVAQPDLLLLVPAVRRLDIRSRGGPEDQDHLELRIRRTTPAHRRGAIATHPAMATHARPALARRGSEHARR